jgi:hypothetical protein
MTVRQHLQKAHEVLAEHHRRMSKIHGAAMGKAVAGDPTHEFHKAAVAAHNTAAENHDSMCDACAKAIGDELDKLVPTNVSGVTPTAPGIRAVPRAGQRQDPEKLEVEPEFAKLVAIPED